MRSSSDVETAYTSCRNVDKKRDASYCHKQVAAGS
jgi:hypothetical protein